MNFFKELSPLAPVHFWGCKGVFEGPGITAGAIKNKTLKLKSAQESTQKRSDAHFPSNKEIL
jgi:hypothetical protein